MTVWLDRLQCRMQGVLPYNQAKAESGGFAALPALTGAPRAPPRQARVVSVGWSPPK